MSSRMTRTVSMPCRVVDFPVFLALAGEIRTDVAAAHRNDHRGGLRRLGSEDLRLRLGDMDADLRHDLDRDGQHEAWLIPAKVSVKGRPRLRGTAVVENLTPTSISIPATSMNAQFNAAASRMIAK
jgi:hypothetical protein